MTVSLQCGAFRINTSWTTLNTKLSSGIEQSSLAFRNDVHFFCSVRWPPRSPCYSERYHFTETRSLYDIYMSHVFKYIWNKKQPQFQVKKLNQKLCGFQTIIWKFINVRHIIHFVQRWSFLQLVHHGFVEEMKNNNIWHFIRFDFFQSYVSELFSTLGQFNTNINTFFVMLSAIFLLFIQLFIFFY